MSSGNRRSWLTCSTAAASGPSNSSQAKRQAATENAGKVSAAAAPQKAKKRVALGNLTNLGIASRASATKGVNKSNAVQLTSSTRKASAAGVHATGVAKNSINLSSTTRIASYAPKTSASVLRNNEAASTNASALPSCEVVASPTHSRCSLSMDETMSTCDSMKSPEFEYVDNGDLSVIASLEQQATKNLHLSEDKEETGYDWKGETSMLIETNGDVVNIDGDDKDPQLCTTIASDIYNHLGMAERKHRPSTDYMERVQKDINASMRAILIDWLVEVAEEYRLVPDTLYLTVNYIDRYLSGNEMSRQRLQLLGVACMLIASKYEEICAPQVEEFCYITDNTYFKEEVLEMEASVLKFLKFEVTAPTAKCFLRRFVRAAQECTEVPQLHIEFLANYTAELSLLEYDMLTFLPSLVAASSVFLAKFILQPSKRPWCSTMEHYTHYNAGDLYECVKLLHRLLCSGSSNGSLLAIREKYSNHKHKFVAKKHCPSTIPTEYFQEHINKAP